MVKENKQKKDILINIIQKLNELNENSLLYVQGSVDTLSLISNLKKYNNQNKKSKV